MSERTGITSSGGRAKATKSSTFPALHGRSSFWPGRERRQSCTRRLKGKRRPGLICPLRPWCHATRVKAATPALRYATLSPNWRIGQGSRSRASGNASRGATQCSTNLRSRWVALSPTAGSMRPWWFECSYWRRRSVDSCAMMVRRNAWRRSTLVLVRDYNFLIRSWRREMVEGEQMARLLWHLRFQPNLDEIVTNVFVKSMPRRHRRNPATRQQVIEVARALAVAVGEFTKPDDSFEEFRHVFLSGYARESDRPT